MSRRKTQTRTRLPRPNYKIYKPCTPRHHDPVVILSACGGARSKINAARRSDAS